MNLRTKCELRLITDPFRDLRPTQAQFRSFDAYVVARQKRWTKKLTKLKRFAIALQRFGFWI